MENDLKKYQSVDEGIEFRLKKYILEVQIYLFVLAYLMFNFYDYIIFISQKVLKPKILYGVQNYIHNFQK